MKQGKAYRIGQVIGFALGLVLCFLFPPLLLIVFRRRLRF